MLGLLYMSYHRIFYWLIINPKQSLLPSILFGG
jgi:hypothetical protein